MTARQLLTLFDSLYLAALSAWIGAAIFFAFGIAPILFNTVGAESALALFRVIYPRYYVGAAISGAIALSAFVAGPLCYPEYRGAMVGVQALAIIFAILLTLYGGNTLAPAICAAAGGGASSRGRFERLQRRAAALNLVVVLIGFSLLGVYAARPAPKTEGLVELTPRERARYDAAVNRVLEDAEVKYGMRPPRPKGSVENAAADPLIDAETVSEIESYYAKKQLRDQARAGKTRTPGTPP